jgi:hypothetical protein
MCVLLRAKFIAAFADWSGFAVTMTIEEPRILSSDNTTASAVIEPTSTPAKITATSSRF